MFSSFLFLICSYYNGINLVLRFFLVDLVNLTATNAPMLCVNRNPWEGNPFNHSKPKPLGKINHSKPKIFPRNQTQTHTQTQQTSFFRHCCYHNKESPLLLSQQKITILSLSRKHHSAPFPSQHLRQATHI